MQNSNKKTYLLIFTNPRMSPLKIKLLETSKLYWDNVGCLNLNLHIPSKQKSNNESK